MNNDDEIGIVLYNGKNGGIILNKYIWYLIPTISLFREANKKGTLIVFEFLCISINLLIGSVEEE